MLHTANRSVKSAFRTDVFDTAVSYVQIPIRKYNRFLSCAMVGFLDMAKITLYYDGKPQEYANARDVTISSAGVLTFYREISEGGSFKKPRVYRFQTSVPFIVEEDVASA
jgi:hypothetical protein